MLLCLIPGPHACQARTFLFLQLLLLLLQRNQESVYEQIGEETLPNPRLWIPSRAPVAIGVAAMSTAQMLASGLKGKGFSVLHTYQDHLWWVHCFFCYGEWGWVAGENTMSLRFRSASIGVCTSSCSLWTPDFHPLAKCGEIHFLLQTRN